MGDHSERLICSCGALIASCKCIHPKTDVIVQDGCTKCRQSPSGGFSERHEESMRLIGRRNLIEMPSPSEPAVPQAATEPRGSQAGDGGGVADGEG